MEDLNITEVWKDIEGMNGKYEVSSYGRVRNKKTNHVRKLSKHSDGYLKVNINRKTYKVHRLVALTFIPNPKNKPQVNHIDEDKTNNLVDNLEWMSHKENMNYGTRTMRASMNTRVAVIAKSIINGDEFLFESVGEASLVTGVNRGNISLCIHGKLKTAGKFVWMKAIS